VAGCIPMGVRLRFGVRPKSPNPVMLGPEPSISRSGNQLDFWRCTWIGRSSDKAP
jgi:hypothetical protein